MIAQVPVMLAAPLAIWLAIDARADARTQRWCFRAVAIWLLATVAWDISTYRDWAEFADDGDEFASVVRLLIDHAVTYAVIAVFWIAASSLPSALLRVAAGVLAVATLAASPLIVSMGDIVQQRATLVVPFGALVLLPAAALCVTTMSKVISPETDGYLGDVKATDTGVAAVIAGAAGLLAVLAREQILAIERAAGPLNDSALIAAVAVGLIFACAVGWLTGVRGRSNESPRFGAKLSAAAAPILIVSTFLFIAILGG